MKVRVKREAGFEKSLEFGGRNDLIRGIVEMSKHIEYPEVMACLHMAW